MTRLLARLGSQFGSSRFRGVNQFISTGDRTERSGGRRRRELALVT
jgi:hypothetical protein